MMIKMRSQVRAGSSKSNRDTSCQLCLLDHTIVMNDIEIEKNLIFYLTLVLMSLVLERNITIESIMIHLN